MKISSYNINKLTACVFFVASLICMESGLAEEKPQEQIHAASADASAITFEKDIRPIFRAHCYDCHGATEELQGGLDLRQVRLMHKGGESGSAIQPGRPSESLLLERIRSGEMPPKGHVPAEEIAIIETWITSGAKTARPEPENLPPGLGITPEERAFWSFQPIERPVIEDLSEFPANQRVRTAIDAILVKSFPENTGFAPDADRSVLVRRAFLDLTGLPPSPEEMETWSKDSADDWYDRLLTDLMNSPHYGERWARHWLDVAGYADSEGYTNTDADRSWAWKYRDWVIKSLNEDKPFDRFITEQLAGDELAGPREGDLTPQQIDLLTATGFLRMAADGTGSGADNAEARNQVVNDTLKIVGTSLLGLSLQCAQCHDHRYDPIPQTDYYALRAVFEPTLDWQAWQVPNSRRISLYTQADRTAANELEAQTKAISDEKSVKLAEYMKQALETELAKFDEPLRTQLREAYETPADKRSDTHKELLAKHPSVNITPGNLYQYIESSKAELAKFDQRINEIRAKKPPEEFIRALIEPPGHVPQTKLFHRGDYQQPRYAVAPAALTVACPEDQRIEFPENDPNLSTTGRRLAFARWLTSSNNPLVARVIANRIWLHHFGKGLVETPSDFGTLGVQPSHPELLDLLADEFMKRGWSLKELHRLIMTSTVWRQTASLPPSGGDADHSVTTIPLTRRQLIRLDAETIRDRMLAASGQLDRTLFGVPVNIKEDDTGQVIVDGSQTRRSLYIKTKRSRPVAMLQAFDAPVMQTNCELRPSSTVATQSLILMNGEFTLGQAFRLAERCAAEATPVSQSVLDSLTSIPRPPVSNWSYGYGMYDAKNDRTSLFTRLEHFTGSQWQAGPELPDAKLGYVLLHATGGHPDVLERAVIRRWTAPLSGTLTIAGKLSHGSPNGDGVRGRIVSSRSGKAGEWSVFNGAADTNVAELTVEAGDTIDFITDCVGSVTSDSFSWPASLKLLPVSRDSKDGVVALDASKEFRGPDVEPAAIVGQIVRAWQLGFCREPQPDELVLAANHITAQLETFQRRPDFVADGRSPIQQAMTNLCQALFSSNEFLYVD
ncbi:MAG: PSD1 and planctomycete cytochrome C domain-containing protein [Planctomycetaceae bacterium]